MPSAATKIAPWGNSDAIRIPRSILKLAGLASGDSVDVKINERNNIELVRTGAEHRRIRPTSGITFETLFGNFVPGESGKPGNLSETGKSNGLNKTGKPGSKVASSDKITSAAPAPAAWPDDDLIGAEYEAWAR